MLEKLFRDGNITIKEISEKYHVHRETIRTILKKGL